MKEDINMRKLLNKLFEWLGYKLLSKNEYDAMNLTLNDVCNAIIEDRYAFTKICVVYQFQEDYDGYMVMLNGIHAVKFFPFGDDKDYAYLCADELCDMLNQKI